MNLSSADFKMAKISGWLFLLIATVYLLSSRGLPWVEADNQLHVAHNLVQRGSLEATAEHGMKIYHHERAYDCHGIANVLYMLPVAAFDHYVLGNAASQPSLLASFLASLSGVVTGALTCVVFFLILPSWQVKTTHVVLTTLCLALLTML